MRPLAESAPANYYYAFMAAKACRLLENYREMAVYIDQALNSKPDAREAQLLKGQFLLKTGELRKAKTLLARLKFNYYNLEYSLTYAEVLLKLNDRDAEKYLYEVFSQNQWHPGVNKLLGLFQMQKERQCPELDQPRHPQRPGAAGLAKRIPGQVQFSDPAVFSHFRSQENSMAGEPAHPAGRNPAERRKREAAGAGRGVP